MTDPAIAQLSEEASAPVPLSRNRDFRRLWLGAGTSRFGSCVAMVVYPMLVLWQTGSAAASGMVAFAATLPNLLLQLPAGALVDRWDRRRVLVVCDTVRLTAFAAMGLAVAGHRLWVPGVMAAAFLEGALAIFYQTAEQVSVRAVVPAEQLAGALSRNQVRGSAVGLLGQPLAGLLFTVLRWLPFAVTSLAELVALVMLLGLRRDLRPAPRAGGGRLHREVAEGIGWLWRHRFLRIMSGVFAGSNLLFQILSLSVMLQVKQHGGTPAALGLVAAVAGVGGLLGALAAGPWLARVSPHTTTLVGHLVWLVLMPLVGVLHDPLQLAAVMAGVLFVGGVFTVCGGVYLVRATPEPLQGRVLASAAFLTSGANALGALAGGFLLSRAGTGGTALVVAAVLLLLTVTVAASPTVRAGGGQALSRQGNQG